MSAAEHCLPAALAKRGGVSDEGYASASEASRVETGAMVRARPTVILVMAILSIVFGSLGLLFWVCSGVGLLILYNVQFPQPGGGTSNPFRELSDLLQKEVPGYAAVEISNYALGFGLAVLLIISGIGLLRMQTWARWTSVIYGVAAIVREIAHVVFTWVYINPVAERWTQEVLRKQPPGTPNFSGNPIFSAILGVAGVILSTAFAVVLLVVLFLPNVTAAFAGRSTRPVEEEEDYYDPQPGDDVPEGR